MKIDVKILEEITRYNQINKYIVEQDVPPATGEEPMLPPPPTDEVAPPLPAAPTGTTEPQVVDVENDPDVEKVGDEKEKREEIEVTDLVKGQKM
jgi:hypothetical protein